VTDDTLIALAAGVILMGLIAYVLLGGADFGGGVWDLFASGPRKREQRDAISHAMGPVWEANHVWLIFIIVALFTCFPRGYSLLAIAFFLPFHLALVGIMLRGASFVFRGYAPPSSQASADGSDAAGGQSESVWGAVFGIASVISPFLLGAAFGALTAGEVRLGEQAALDAVRPIWLSPYAVGCGLLAISACAYLAAVYLTVETDGALRDDFRRRAIFSGTSTAALAVIVLLLAWYQATWFFSQLTSTRSWPVLAAGTACFAASAWAVFGRRYRLSRIFAAGEITLLLLGWGLAQQPYLVYPDMTLKAAAAPRATIAFLLATLPFGALLLIPSLWLLLRTFKSYPPAS
jgi:cytochrome bd ubiquinol oxidase subunit II